MEEEQWIKIEGYDKYSVSNYGQVRNDKNGKLLPQRNNGYGYYIVDLRADGIRNTAKIHRLVAQAFCSNENQYEIVDHIDRNPINNHFLNLRWCTQSQNNRNRNKKADCSSRYIGVSFNMENKKWRARLSINRKLIYLGQYDTEEEAYEAFKQAVVENNLQDFYNL